VLDFITLTDGYKLDHRRQYPPGTQYVYSNFTPRSTRIPGQDKVVFFGLQYFLKRYLGEIANDTFFHRPRARVLCEYENLVKSYLGPEAANAIGINHIADLHDLGYIPLQFWALPEGTRVPLRVPMFTFQNTHPDFGWVTNYIETLLSSVLWLGCTSATTAYRYRKLLSEYARKTGDEAFVGWQAHDFSFRGMASPEAAALSGAAHLLSFTGTDTIPAIKLLERYYGATGLIGGSVAATEHSVMCAGGQSDELETFRRLLKLYPTGILSVVSDTWDLWNVVGNILPQLKDEILARDGKLVIRPDSGNPADILCGPLRVGFGSGLSPEGKGVIELLWDIFGGTTNEKGYRVLNPRIGAIYGDSITEDRARDICARLEGKGFATTNVVLGVGSYTYTYVTRDTNGFAVKATWAQVNDQEHQLFKDPVTDDGVKRSAKGRLVVMRVEEELTLIDGLNTDEWTALHGDQLHDVWSENKFAFHQSLTAVRETLASS
jgi:nicotinamide phosphoribosyltransferase